MSNLTHLLTLALTFEAAHWQAQLALAVTQLPSIIVALTPYPKEQGLAKKVLQVLNLLSFLVHKDSPGTLKFPFLQSPPPGVIGSKLGAAPAPRGYAIPWLLFVLVLGLPLLLVAAVWAWARGVETYPEMKRRWRRGEGSAGGLRAAVLVLCLGALSGLCSCAAITSSQWGAPIFSSGPSLQLVEVSPSNPHPLQLAAGAGYSVALGEGQVAIGGKQWDLLDVSLQVLGSVISPSGGPAGALQVAPMLGTMNDMFAIGPILTPYAADGSGFLQGGRPGTSWGIHLSFPIGLGPYAPPTGIEHGARGLPRGGTLYLP